MSHETLERTAHHPKSLEDMISAVGRGDDETAAECFLEIVEATLDKLPANLDLQHDRIESLERDIDRMIEPFMEHPEVSVKAEFALLRQLYDRRALTEVTQLGARQTEFGTRNSGRDSIDHHFRILEFPSGKDWYVDETTFGGKRLPTTVMLQDNDLVIRERYYEKGSFRYREIDPTDAQGKTILKAFFTDTILAAHLGYTRSPEEAETADAEAWQLLLDRQNALSERGSQAV